MSFAYSPINLDAAGTAAGGGAGAGVGVRVGPSGGDQVVDYYTIGSATAAGQSVVHVIGDIVETANVNVTASGLDVILYNDAIVAMGTNVFQVETGETLGIEGDGTITFGNVAGGTLFNGSGELHIENISIENTSNNAVCLTNMDYARVDSVRFEGDVRICGDFNIFSDCLYRNGSVFITSPANKSAIHGAVCENVLIIDSGTNSVVSDILSG